MAAMTDFMENKLIDWFFRGQAIGITGASAGAGSGPTALFVGLYTTVPVDAGTGGVEVSGGSYARVSITSGPGATGWSGTTSVGQTTTPSAGNTGTTSNNGVVTFPAPTANWGTITGFGIFDAVSGGNLLIFGTLTANKTVNNGDAAPSFAANALSFQIDN